MRRLPETLLQNAQKSHLRVKGQATVEFALLLPLLLFMGLGFLEGGILLNSQRSMQNSVDVLAKIAAEKIETIGSEDWEAVILEEITRSSDRCAESPNIAVSYPDVTTESGDRVKVSWSCPYAPLVTNGLWPGLRITVESEAVINLPNPEPTPLPSAIPSAPPL